MGLARAETSSEGLPSRKEAARRAVVNVVRHAALGSFDAGLFGEEGRGEITSIPYHGSEGLGSAFSTIFLRVATRAGRAGKLEEEASRLRRADDDSEPDQRALLVATSKKLWKSAP